MTNRNNVNISSTYCSVISQFDEWLVSCKMSVIKAHYVVCSQMADRAAAMCSVGKYRVMTSSFEACALPALTLPVRRQFGNCLWIPVHVWSAVVSGRFVVDKLLGCIFNLITCFYSTPWLSWSNNAVLGVCLYLRPFVHKMVFQFERNFEWNFVCR